MASRFHDLLSLPRTLFLDGAKIDFIDTPTAKGFSIDNPMFPPGAGCAGCGH